MMLTRPPMHARDASGRQVSLLNDEQPAAERLSFTQPSYSAYEEVRMKRANSYVSAAASSPRTPDLLRADSYDSNMSVFSPLTPTSIYEFSRQGSFSTAYPDPSQCDQRSFAYGAYPEKSHSSELVRPSFSSHTSSFYDDDAVSETASDRQVVGKRYPCRYKDSHSCDKTFTTSGHASRHSKIHTAEKAVNCSFAGCQKKFTRADNMKQHLETHYKDRSRTSQKAAHGKLSSPVGVRKSTSTPHRPASRAAAREAYSYDSYMQFSTSASTSPLPSPVSPLVTMDMHTFQHALPLEQDAPRISVHQRSSSATYRLDALASIASDSR